MPRCMRCVTARACTKSRNRSPLRTVIIPQVMQFLQERGLTETLEVMSRETKHVMSVEGGGGQLCSILAEYEDMKMMEVTQEVLRCSVRLACPRSRALMLAAQVDESLAALELQLRAAAADGSHAKMPAAAVHEVPQRPSRVLRAARSRD